VPNNLLYSFDLSGAEWVVCAFVSQDVNMMRVYEEGKDPHTWTGHLISGVPEDIIKKENKIVGQESDAEKIEALRRKHLPQIFKNTEWFLPRVMSIRQAGKKSNHGLNYDESAERFALENEIEYSEARPIHARYHAVYPGIQRGMHLWIQHQLGENRTLINCWGEKREFREAWGKDLFKAAYSFIPQSTVVHITDETMIQCYADTSPLVRDLELLQEVHDNLRGQYPIGNWKKAAQMVMKVQKYMSPVCSYWGRDFVIGVDLKVGLSAGDMIEMEIPSTVIGVENALKKAYKALTARS